MSSSPSDERRCTITVKFGQLYMCSESPYQRTERRWRAAKLLQNAWRRKQSQMSRSIQMRSATIAEKRLKLSRQETAAKQIQAYWRMALVRSRYTKLKSSIIFIQRQTRKHISNRRIAALVIQRAYRLYCVKRMRKMSVSGIRNSKVNMHQDTLRFLRLRSAALYTQKSFLKRRRLKDIKNAAILIQSWWRSVIARRLFNQQRAGAVIIQSAWRSFVKLRHASVSIQSWWRFIKASRLLKKKKAAAILIQSYWQTYNAKRRFILFRRKVILVQSRWRSVKIRNSFKKKRAAALAIQSVWRSYIAKRRFKMLKCASVCIQRWWKQNSRESAIIYQNLCAVKIQAAFRSYSTKMRYFKIRKAVLLIQSIFRLKRTKRNLPQLTNEKAPVKQPIYNISKLPTLASGVSKRKISNDLNTDSKRILLIPAISEKSSENIENKDPDDSRKRKCKALLETAPPIKKFNRETTFTVDSNEIQEKSIEVLLSEKRKRLEEIQSKKEALKSKIFQHSKVVSIPANLTSSQLMNVTKKNTENNQGYQFSKMKLKSVFRYGEAPPSPTTILEQKMANRGSAPRTFLQMTNETHAATKLKWNTKLVEILECPKQQQVKEPKKPCLKQSSTWEMPDLCDEVIVQKYIYKKTARYK